jgi:DNA processing protein
MDSEGIAYHALAVAKESSYAALTKLKSRYGTWQAAWRGEHPGAPEEKWGLEEHGISLILFEDDRYPALLREIPHPPHALYIKGALPESPFTIAIAGTRKATPGGKEAAQQFAKRLAEDALIVSGLAFGIDAAAHAGALAAKGKTAAILACGLDTIYPASHAGLAEKILACGGALVSEYPPETPPLPYRFLERNRIISGLSQSVLIIEAPARSGAIATARFALEQNRNVFVLPGPAAHPNFRGSHALIREGATLTTTPEELLSDMGILTDHHGESEEYSSEEERLIRAALRNAARPLSVDEIIEVTMLEPRIANQNLAMLVIRNEIREEGPGYAI